MPLVDSGVALEKCPEVMCGTLARHLQTVEALKVRGFARDCQRIAAIPYIYIFMYIYFCIYSCKSYVQLLYITLQLQGNMPLVFLSLNATLPPASACFESQTSHKHR